MTYRYYLYIIITHNYTYVYTKKNTIIHYLYCILKITNYAYMAASTTVQQPWLQKNLT